MGSQRPCPFCAEPILTEAIKCRHCGTALSGGALSAGAKDEEHLRYLEIGHYVVAGLTALIACMFLLHVFFGIAIVVAPDSFFKEGPGKGPPPIFGWLAIVMGSAALLSGWTLAGLLFAAGRAIGRRRRLLFCMVVAALACLVMPFGTILGIFTLLTLCRPSVKLLFEANRPA